MPSIIFHRPDLYPFRLSKLTILIDDVPAGKIGAGATVTLPVSAGKHAVRVRNQLLWGSPELTLDLRDDERCDVDIRFFRSDWKLGLLLPFYMAPALPFRKRLFVLHRR